MVKVQQRGLGKGLSALISENYAQAPAASAPAAAAPQPAETLAGGASELDIRQIVPGKYQPRTVFNEEHLKELSASILKNGVMQPIIVRQLAREGSDVYEIVAGERRWRAAALAGLATIPAIVRDISDQQALELAIIENVQRADLTPLEESGGYQRLLEEFGYTQEELSSVVGKSRSHIANLLRLLTLPEDIKTLLDEGKLSMGHARALLSAKDPSLLARMIAQKGLSVRQAESLARASHHSPEERARPPAPRPQRPTHLEKLTQNVDALVSGKPLPKDSDILALEVTLTTNLRMPVHINDHGETGEVVIVYHSLTDLDTLLQKLGGGI